MQIDLNQVSQELQSVKNDLHDLLVPFRNINAATTADASQVPFVAQLASRPPAATVADGSLTINIDGTISRKMD